MNEELLLATGKAISAVQEMLDQLSKAPGADPRSTSVARTQFETGFLWAANAAAGETVLS